MCLWWEEVVAGKGITWENPHMQRENMPMPWNDKSWIQTLDLLPSCNGSNHCTTVQPLLCRLWLQMMSPAKDGITGFTLLQWEEVEKHRLSLFTIIWRSTSWTQRFCDFSYCVSLIVFSLISVYNYNSVESGTKCGERWYHRFTVRSPRQIMSACKMTRLVYFGYFDLILRSGRMWRNLERLYLCVQSQICNLLSV